MRTCLVLARGYKTDAAFHAQAVRAASKIARDPGQFFQVSSEDMDEDTPHTIICVRPTQDRDTYTMEIPTPYLKDIIARQVAEVDTVKQSIFFTQISTHPWLRSATGYLFEKFLHIRLTVPSASLPLICTPITTDAPPLAIPTSLRAVPLSGFPSLKNSRKHDLPFYWRPVSPTFPVVDAIICGPTEVILLQCTVSQNHGFNAHGIRRIRESFTAPFLRARRLCLVFTVDSATTAAGYNTQKLKQLGNVLGIPIYTTINLICRPLQEIEESPVVSTRVNPGRHL